MNCLHCGKDIDADSAFCRFCGSPATASSAANRKLVRHPSRGRIAGVCAGIADYLGADVALVRLLWVILSIVPGGLIGGLVAYLAAWILMPDAAVSGLSADSSAQRLTRSATNRKIAGVCGGVAEYLGIDSTVVRVVWAVLAIVPGAVVLGVAAYLVAWFIMPEGSRQLLAPAQSAA